METDFRDTPEPDDQSLSEPETGGSENRPEVSPDTFAPRPSGETDAGVLLAEGRRLAEDGAFDRDSLRRLFHSPFFHQRDGLDDYDDDYRQSFSGEAATEALARLARQRRRTIESRKPSETDRAPDNRPPETDETAPAGRPPQPSNRSRVAPREVEKQEAEREVGPFRFRPDRCARSTGKVQGCHRCEAACPKGAVSVGNNGLDIAPHRCDTCGICAAICPSGAIRAPMDPSATLLPAAGEWMNEHRQEHPFTVLMLHGGITTASPAPEPDDGCLSIDLSEPGFIGAETFSALLAVGFDAVRLHLPEDFPEDRLPGILRQIHLADEIVRGMGFPPRTIALDRQGARATSAKRRPGERRTPDTDPPDVAGDRRDLLRWALAALTDPAGATPDPVTLPQGAPLGTLSVAAERCTLCMACIGLCTTGALTGGGGTPRITFTEAACIQCGRCASGCPEGAVTLVPGLDAGSHVTRRQQVVAEETPLPCIRCGAPFATRKMIDTITARLAGNPMFATDAEKRRLRMCAGCRIKDRFEPSPE